MINVHEYWQIINVLDQSRRTMSCWIIKPEQNSGSRSVSKPCWRHFSKDPCNKYPHCLWTVTRRPYLDTFPTWKIWFPICTPPCQYPNTFFSFHFNKDFVQCTVSCSVYVLVMNWNWVVSLLFPLPVLYPISGDTGISMNKFCGFSTQLLKWL